MGLRDIGATLPPGFRFYPSDEELVCHYLYKKIANEDVLKGTLVEIDLHTCEPWQLPDVAKLNSTEWYFFSFRDRKYATGYRTNRATISGYWKATGKDRTIVDHRTNVVVGMRKTLVFYQNRAPNGIKTGWIMHEFRRENPHIPPKEDWVLCRVFHKAKSENSNEVTVQNELDTTTVADCPHLSASTPTHYQTFPYGHHPTTSLATQCLPHLHNHNNSSIINLPDFSSLNPPSLPNLSQAPPNEMIYNSNCAEDKYGYLFDMVFEDSDLGDRVPSNMEDMRFDGDDDSGLVFL